MLSGVSSASSRLRGALFRAARAPLTTRRPEGDGPELQIHSALLAGVSAGFAASDDLSEVLQSAACATRDALGYYSVNVFLLDEGSAVTDPNATLAVVASAGASTQLSGASPYTQPVSVGLVGRAARQDEIVLANVVPVPGYHLRPGTEHVASELCVPIRVDRAVIGILNLESDRRHAFTAHDVRTASILADQMAVAVSRWRLQRDRAARAGEIERLQSFNESIVQGIREGIVVADETGRIKFANRRLEQMLSYPPGFLIGRNWLDFVPPAWRETLERRPDRRGPWGSESRLMTRDGLHIAVQVAGQPRTEAGAAEGTVLLFTDISGRVRAERVARALGEAGMALQVAESVAALRQTLSDEAVRSGLSVAVLAGNEKSQSLSLELLSLEQRRMKALERALGRGLIGIEVPANGVLSDLRRGEAVFVADAGSLVGHYVDADDAGKIARLLRLGPTMLVPLRTASRRAGLVAVGHPELAESDGPIATAFAHQVATALDRARLHAETEDRARQVAVFAETAQHLAATVDMVALADGVARQLRRVFTADAATLYVLDEALGHVELAGADGLSAHERALSESTVPSRHPAWVIHNRQALLTGDGAQDPRVVFVGSRPRFTSVMMVPIVIEAGRCLGALGVSSRRLYAWNTGDLRLFSTLADQVAVAVANALRVREANRRAAQLERVGEAGRTLGLNVSSSELMLEGLGTVAGMFDITSACAVLIATDGRVSENAQLPSAVQILNQGDDCAWLAEIPAVLCVPELRESTVLRPLEMTLVEAGVHSVLVAPLRARGTVIGGLILMAREGERSFGQESAEIAGIAADQISAGLENARLLRDTLAAHQRTEAVVRLSFTAMLTVDSVGRIREANPAASQLLGKPRDGLVGSLLDAALGNDLWLDPDGPLSAARTSGAIPPPREAELNLAGGRVREVLLGVAPLPDGYLVSMADITRLKELDRLKTELVANVSHELRSPLASIKAYTELLLDGLVPDEATERRFLGIIDGQAERLSQCISNLLDLARVEAEGYVVSRERFALRSFAREAMEAVSLRAQSKEIELDVLLPAGDLLVNGDRPILFSSLKNLLDNAVKYSGPGARVLLSFDDSPEGLTITVDDEGPGIPEDELDRIFEKFYRVSAAHGARPEGSGLGLVIAREAARVHGGDVTVSSRVGKGSRFTLFLPPYMIERAGTFADPAGLPH